MHSPTLLVSRRSIGFANLQDLLAEDVQPDFCWYRTPQIDPAKCSFIYAQEDPARLDHFFGGKFQRATAVQFHLCRPQYDYLQLQYPDQAFYELLNLDTRLEEILLSLGHKHWAYLAVTSEIANNVCMFTRSFLFPDADAYNAANSPEIQSFPIDAHLLSVLNEQICTGFSDEVARKYFL